MTETAPNPIRTLHTDVEERPFIVIWEVTRACELVCAHCRADAQHHRDPLELTTDDGFRLLDDLAAYGPPRPMVVLTGGDPFERPDLEELVEYGTSIGLHVSLSPSVTPLLTPDRLARVRAAGASAVSLSLDGAESATHDGFRGVAGVFDRTLEAASEVRDAGLRLQINTTVTADNVGELPRILDIVTGMDAGLWSVFFLVPTGRHRHRGGPPLAARGRRPRRDQGDRGPAVPAHRDPEDEQRRPRPRLPAGAVAPPVAG